MREWLLSPEEKVRALPGVGVAELSVLWAGDHQEAGSHFPGTRLLAYSSRHCFATSRATNHPRTSWPQQTDILSAGKWKVTGDTGSSATRISPKGTFTPYANFFTEVLA